MSVINESATLLEAAHTYAAMGLPVFPIRPLRKTPLTTHGFKDATTDHAQIDAWWDRWPEANVGLATGHLADVVDLDGLEAWRVWDDAIDEDHKPTVLGQVSTPREFGAHLYIAPTGKTTATGMWGTKIDYRGMGGYVILPPSYIEACEDHNYEGPYRWVDDLDLQRLSTVPLDHWWPEPKITNQLAGEVPTMIFTAPDDDLVRAYVEKAVAYEVDQVSSAPQGTRNPTLNRAAFNLGTLVPRYLPDAQVVTSTLMAAAAVVGLSAPEAQKTIQSGLKGGMLSPRDLSGVVAATPLAQEVPWEALQGPSEATDALEAIWGFRSEFQHVYDYAMARMVSPWAVLGNVIIRTLTSVPPTVVLPAVVGGQGNLNTFLVVLGDSGTGKDAASLAAADAVKIIDQGSTYLPRVANVGSGEGIVHQYAWWDKKEQVRHDDQRVMFMSPEVNLLSALGARSGATLIEVIKMAFSGLELGNAYAAREKAMTLPAGTYRLTMVINAQPINIEPVLKDNMGGLPQRLLWLPSTDPRIPDEPDPAPQRWVIEDQHWPNGHLELSVPNSVKMVMQRERGTRMRNDQRPDLEGHSRYVQLKVAQALALMAGRRAMITDDWDIADLIMKKSTRTRDAAVAVITAANAAKRNAEHRTAADRAVVVDSAKEARAEAVEARAVEGFKIRLLDALSSGPVPVRTARAWAMAKYRHQVDQAISLLVGEGRVTRAKDGRRTMLRLTS